MALLINNEPNAIAEMSPGRSVAGIGRAAGTIGAIVRCNATGRPGFLSNWHVLSNGIAQPGDLIVNATRDLEITPQFAPVATLGPYYFGPKGDAAVAWWLPNVNFSEFLAGTEIRLAGWRRPKVGDILAKVGGRTRFTRARVIDVGEYPVTSNHGSQSIEGFYLEPLDSRHHNESVCASGDGGAVWFDEMTHEAVGLHYAVEKSRFNGDIYARACFIDLVLDQLNVSLWRDKVIH